MKKKERQRIKKANKLLVSALMLGALTSPALAADPVVPAPTLNKINVASTSVIANMTSPITLTTTKPASGEYLTVKIGGTTYYYQGDLPSGIQLTDLQNLANTGSAALTTSDPARGSNPIYKIGEISYYYDSSKLPQSSYVISSSEASDYNYFVKDSAGNTSYYQVQLVQVIR